MKQQLQWISINIYMTDINDNDYKKATQKEMLVWSQGWVIREMFVCGNCKNRGCIIEVDFGHPLPGDCLCPDLPKLLTA